MSGTCSIKEVPPPGAVWTVMSCEMLWGSPMLHSEMQPGMCGLILVWIIPWPTGLGSSAGFSSQQTLGAHQIFLCKGTTGLVLKEQKEDKCYHDYLPEVPTSASMDCILVSEFYFLPLAPHVLFLSPRGHLGRESCMAPSPLCALVEPEPGYFRSSLCALQLLMGFPSSHPELEQSFAGCGAGPGAPSTFLFCLSPFLWALCSSRQILILLKLCLGGAGRTAGCHGIHSS